MANVSRPSQWTKPLPLPESYFPHESNGQEHYFTNEAPEGAKKTVSTSGGYTFSRRQDNRMEKLNSLALKPAMVYTTSSGAPTEPLPGIGTSDQDLLPYVPELRKKNISALLGENYHDMNRVYNRRADSQATLMRTHESSSTLHSCYDAQKFPLAVSQQTSNSSARDLALRKGCPPVITTSLVEQERSRGLQGKEPHTFRASLNTKKSRPSRLDLSKLFPRPTPKGGPLLSPQRYMDSPPPLSSYSEVAIMGHGSSPGNSKGRLQAMSTEGEAHSPVALRQTSAVSWDPPCSKINIAKPKAGTKNWFDGLEDEEDDETVNDEPQWLDDFVANFDSAFRNGKATPLSVSTSSSGFGRAPIVDNSKKIKYSGASLKARSPNSAASLVSATSIEVLLALQTWEEDGRHIRTHRASSARSISKKGKAEAFEKVNLQKQSVLYISSSEDEDETNTDAKQDMHIPVLQDSLAEDLLDDSEVKFGIAQTVRTNLMVNRLPSSADGDVRRPSHHGHRGGSTNILPIEVPNRRSSRMHTASAGEPAPYTTSPQSGLHSRRPLEAYVDKRSVTPHDPVASQSSLQRQMSARVMAVTREEESLLEAMRSKKASMRHTILAEAYKSALDESQGSEIVPQPARASQPASNGANSSFLRLSQATILVDPNVQQFPGSGDGRPVQGTFSRSSTVADSRSDTASCSRRASLIHSEALTSPTTSRASPITPTLVQIQSSSALRSTAGTSPEPSMAANDECRIHSRTRTTSSHFILLDDLGDDLKRPIAPEDFPAWACSNFRDRSVVAVVQ